MITQHTLSHVAMSIPRAELNDALAERVDEFYSRLLGWRVNPKLSIPGDRMLIDLPGEGQYLNLKARDQPMRTSGYEHFGVYVDNKQDVYALHEGCAAFADGREDFELDEDVQVLYGGQLTTFRFHYLLPLAVEVQHVQLSRGDV